MINHNWKSERDGGGGGNCLPGS